MTFLVVKALHILAVISWMAGMLYLPRLMVYHADAPQGSVQSETFKVMERRLLRAIMTPAMIGSWAFGLWLAYLGGYFASWWLHGKLAAVLGLSAVHMALAGWVRQFAGDRNRHSARFFRVINEVPTVLLVLAVFLVVLKPF